MGHLLSKDIFHVHTFRCKHAGRDRDEAYVEKAISLGARSVTFTDHAPFPGDPFDSRMEIAELPEYLSTLNELRIRYKNHIRIGIGLEIEYLPGFEDYYRSLYNNEKLDFMMLGQHFFRDANGDYSFYYKRTKLLRDEPRMLGNAMVKALNTGMFPYVAHPDRIFRKRFIWDDGLAAISEEVVATAAKNGVRLEKNIASIRKGYYRPQFWKIAGNRTHIFIGVDAHSVLDLELLDSVNAGEYYYTVLSEKHQQKQEENA